MQMFIAVSTYQQPLDTIDRARAAHLDWVERQYVDGRFLTSGRQVPPVGGVIVAAAGSRQELADLLAGDPFVRAGLAHYELIEFTPTATSFATPGFGAFAAGAPVSRGAS